MIICSGFDEWVFGNDHEDQNTHRTHEGHNTLQSRIVVVAPSWGPEQQFLLEVERSKICSCWHSSFGYFDHFCSRIYFKVVVLFCPISWEIVFIYFVLFDSIADIYTLILHICIRSVYNLIGFTFGGGENIAYIQLKNVTKVIKFCGESFDMFSVLGSPNSNKIFLFEMELPPRVKCTRWESIIIFRNRLFFSL